MNRLADAVSPYLRAHAGNPVDWWPWGEEAFAEARRRDVPVLISIGYATCHWCHVMARESFSDPQVAAQLNERFVSIKVDREEHPEVDASYITAAGAFTRELGWPLTVFATPEGRTFYAGTYFPPQPMVGRPSFPQLLDAVTEAWTQRREQAEGTAAAIAEALAARPAAAGTNLPDEAALAAAVAGLASHEDPQFGGFGGAPKFPVATVLGFLAARGAHGDANADGLVRRTLDAMAASPLRDPVEGGFFRYATQRDWSDPHYERMLYDNALLLRVAARLGSREVAEGVARFLLEVLRVPGGFASAQDSESEIDGRRVEGGYYKLDADERTRQKPPALDEKVLTGWNGLAIEALVEAGERLDRPDLIDAARGALDELLERHLRDGRLARASSAGRLSDAVPTLEDFGMLAGALLRVATATGEVRYAELARQFADAAIAAGAESGLPFAAAGGADPVLAARGLALPLDPSEGAYPSGVSAMGAACATLFALTADPRYSDAARAAVGAVATQALQSPIAFGATLELATRLAAPLEQLVVVAPEGRADDPVVTTARRMARGVVAVVTPQQAAAWSSAGFELLEGRTARDGRATAYLCRDFVCRLPEVEAERLASQVSEPLGG
ncbi:hypothetical protein CLV46_0954 [Diaminobutyricimonas aerilata]|uniref:Spermatogenesis-associated protein 20-like TRX domain-containing protein n=1 Tax=Diaminobutyricimonas aerilata TaxID=1162967 RepID=A0A2M9CHP7_9MICO|nr:thioredoxin domain-containing protein [Diaminobutyricimonas aerilata]PJJ71408.1 hypothetical protein CLV46_0954 [Diaminobutyricimonas aerilata]